MANRRNEQQEVEETIEILDSLSRKLRRRGREITIQNSTDAAQAGMLHALADLSDILSETVAEHGLPD